jgi:hypothetical protein
VEYSIFLGLHRTAVRFATSSCRNGLVGSAPAGKFQHWRQGAPAWTRQRTETPLSGERPFLVGRSNQAALRVSKELMWVSNKHFALERDGATGRVQLRDTSSNGTWVNDEQVPRDTPYPLQPGDQIMLAAEEGPGEKRQVTFRFVEAALGASATGTTDSPTLGKRQRLSPDGASRTLISGNGNTLLHVPCASFSDAETGGAPAASAPAASALVLAELEESRARCQQLEAQLAAERDLRAVAAERAALEAREVLCSELRYFEEDAALRTESASELERLTLCASEANQQLQRLSQERLADVEAREAAERQLQQQVATLETAQQRHSELEAALSAAWSRAEEASKEVRQVRAEACELRTKLALLGSEAMRLGERITAMCAPEAPDVAQPPPPDDEGQSSTHDGQNSTPHGYA